MSPPESNLLVAACGGDEDAFRRLVDPHRAALHSHCSRMLGSRDDAEDALQESLLHAWRGLCRFDGRSAFHRWLYRITTNACLDVIARKRAIPKQHLDGEADAQAAPEARYEQREAVDLAFSALQHLPPRQRAVLVLREVFGFSAKEVSDSLGTTVASVNSALQRARNTVDERLPDTGRLATPSARADRCLREPVERFVTAFEQGDVDAVVALLGEDVSCGELRTRAAA